MFFLSIVDALSLLNSCCGILDYYTFILFLNSWSLLSNCRFWWWHNLIKRRKVKDSPEPILHTGEHLILQSFHFLRTHITNYIITAFYNIIWAFYFISIPYHLIHIAIDRILITYPLIIDPSYLAVNSSASVAVAVVDEDLVTDARGQ